MENLVALVVFAIATSGAPGPNVLMVAAAAANRGVRAVLPHMLGITLGFPIMLLVVALGLGLPFAALAWLHSALQVAGGLWLLFLASKIATAPPPGEAGAAPPLGFWGAAAFQWVNPKAWLIALAAVPAFATDEAPMLPQGLLIGVVFAAVSMPLLLAWEACGAVMRRWLGSTGRRRAFN